MGAFSEEQKILYIWYKMGTFFREVEQSNVDLEDLLKMLKKKPKIMEDEDAVPYDPQ